MLGAAYVQPIAGHIDHSSYLIVRDASNTWYLWTGEFDQELTDIPEALANWLRTRPEIEDFPDPLLWFDLSSLPVSDRPLFPTFR